MTRNKKIIPPPVPATMAIGNADPASTTQSNGRDEGKEHVTNELHSGKSKQAVDIVSMLSEPSPASLLRSKVLNAVMFSKADTNSSPLRLELRK